MSDEDFAAAGRGGAKASGGPGKHRGPRFTWNPQYEATFFRSLCESVSLGLRDGSTFKPEAWERAMQALIDKHNAYANKGHLINKTDNARKKYRLWRGLREDPEFFYNPQTRTVTATDDAWARHLQKEPLARSLRSRPFEHEEYYEILFPDVIGSGGAPKRLMKPRRKGTDSSLNGAEDHDAPGTAIMDLLTDTAYINPSQTHLPPPIPQTTMPPPLPTHAPPPPQHHQHPHAPANTMPPPPPPPPRSSVSSTSALTPPEETALQTRKRSHAPDGGVSSNGTGQQPPDKRRRTAPPGYLDLTLPSQPQPQQQQQLHQPPPQPPQAANGPTSSSSTAITTSASSSTPPALTTLPLTLTEGILLLADALRSGTTTTTTSSSRGGGGLGLGGGGGGSKAAAHLLRPAPVPGWQEQAMDIFFRDFAGEDMDLQLKIAEKVLADENKAMVFCKMPDALRRHWVKRLREMHNRVV